VIYNRTTSKRKYDVTPAGEKDGLNTVFLLPEAFIPVTLSIYINGIQQSAVDLSQLDGSAQTFELVIPPIATDFIRADYDPA
jgi:hypothetical protein